MKPKKLGDKGGPNPGSVDDANNTFTSENFGPANEAQKKHVSSPLVQQPPSMFAAPEFEKALFDRYQNEE
jgi:hypothetical protein